LSEKVRNSVFIARAWIVIRNTSLRHDDSGPGYASLLWTFF